MIYHIIRVLLRLLRAKGIFTAEEYEQIEIATREDDYAKSYPERTMKAVERVCEATEMANKYKNRRN
jgi:hypothetical protein